MNAALERFSPGITSMIRMDHTHVAAVFHRYKDSTSPARKRALVDNACLALEIHAQLEEEIFYPALRAAIPDDHVLDKSVPEHDQMRRLIAELRSLQPGDAAFDRTFRDLMRAVLHHVADEETTLLPEAERVLGDQLGELGVQMTKRRLQLLKPHASELAVTTAKSFPAAAMALAVGSLMVGALLFHRRART
jgi:hypothetical protein